MLKTSRLSNISLALFWIYMSLILNDLGSEEYRIASRVCKHEVGCAGCVSGWNVEKRAHGFWFLSYLSSTICNLGRPLNFQPRRSPTCSRVRETSSWWAAPPLYNVWSRIVIKFCDFGRNIIIIWTPLQYSQCGMVSRPFGTLADLFAFSQGGQSKIIILPQ